MLRNHPLYELVKDIKMSVLPLSYVILIYFFKHQLDNLGVFMCAAKTFKLSVTQPRASFYKSLNLLLTRSRRRFDDTVLLSLIKNFCL